jgi:hypothetical protein
MPDRPLWTFVETYPILLLIAVLIIAAVITVICRRMSRRTKRMNTDDLRCWFDEFGVRGLALIDSTPECLTLTFADGLRIEIEPAPFGRCTVNVWRNRFAEPPEEYQDVDLQRLVALLRGEGKEIRVG